MSDIKGPRGITGMVGSHCSPVLGSGLEDRGTSLYMWNTVKTVRPEREVTVTALSKKKKKTFAFHQEQSLSPCFFPERFY